MSFYSVWLCVCGCIKLFIRTLIKLFNYKTQNRRSDIELLFAQTQVTVPRSSKLAVRQKPTNWTYFPIPRFVSLSSTSMLSSCLRLPLLYGVLLGILGTKLRFHYKCLEVLSAYTSYTVWYCSHFYPELRTTDKLVHIVRDLWDTDSSIRQSQTCCLDRVAWILFKWRI